MFNRSHPAIAHNVLRGEDFTIENYDFCRQGYLWLFVTAMLRAPLKIHFGGQANLFDCGRRQTKAALASTKADLSSLPECNPDQSGLLAAQKQLLELPLITDPALNHIIYPIEV